jgi:hypothetical protein
MADQTQTANPFRAKCTKCGAMFDEAADPSGRVTLGLNMRDADICRQQPIQTCPEFKSVLDRYRAR